MRISVVDLATYDPSEPYDFDEAADEAEAAEAEPVIEAIVRPTLWMVAPQASAEEWEAWSAADVAAILDGAPRPTPPAGERPVSPKRAQLAEPHWRRALQLSEKGKILPTTANLARIVENDDALAGAVGINEITRDLVWLRPRPWATRGGPEFSEADASHCNKWLARQYGISLDLHKVGEALAVSAYEHSFDPLHDYLAGLVWDGVLRLDTWLPAYCGSADTPYTRGVGACWMISAAARGLKPGSKVDSALVFEGPEGVNKSTLLKILGGDWATDSPVSTQSKDSAIKLTGSWVVELAEGVLLEKESSEAVKAWFTATFDQYRPPYAKVDRKFFRRCVFAVTVNPKDYHTDATGGRRFWPVKVGSIDLDAVKRDRDQLWAEAVHRYRAGEQWWLTPEVAQLAAAEIAAKRPTSAWGEAVEAFLAGRRDATMGEIFAGAIYPPSDGRRGVGHIKRDDEDRLAKILRGMGWDRGYRGPKTRRERCWVHVAKG